VSGFRRVFVFKITRNVKVLRVVHGTSTLTVTRDGAVNSIVARLPIALLCVLENWLNNSSVWLSACVCLQDYSKRESFEGRAWHLNPNRNQGWGSK